MFNLFIMRYFFLHLLWALPTLATAGDAQPPRLEALPEAPKLSQPITYEDELEPEITIVRSGKNIIHEFRRGGQLYMIKIVPDIGPAYYFVDINGDGILDVRSYDLDRGSHVNLWKLLEWD